jgi:hypothetical protein
LQFRDKTKNVAMQPSKFTKISLTCQVKSEKCKLQRLIRNREPTIENKSKGCRKWKSLGKLEKNEINLRKSRQLIELRISSEYKINMSSFLSYMFKNMKLKRDLETERKEIKSNRRGRK